MQLQAIKISGSTIPELAPSQRPERVAVVLLNLGTPDAPTAQAVRPYLVEFLSDPEVISLPRGWRWFTPLLARLIAFFRAKGSAANYAMIWTSEGSPLLVFSQKQAAALESELGSRYRVYVAMRYGNPALPGVFDQIRAEGISEVVLIPMYPHWAGATVGTALSEAYNLMRCRGLRWNTHVVATWHDFEPYLDAQADLIQRYLEENRLSPKDTVVLFSAHSLPVSYIKAGDPYEGMIRDAIERISARLEWPADRIRTSFQSRLGPVEWLGPQTDKMLEELAAEGVKNVAAVPVSFTADCVETCHEVGIEYRHLFEGKLGGKLWLIPALNDDPTFILALKALVGRTLGGL